MPRPTRLARASLRSDHAAKWQLACRALYTLSRFRERVAAKRWGEGARGKDYVVGGAPHPDRWRDPTSPRKRGEVTEFVACANVLSHAAEFGEVGTHGNVR